MNATFKSLLLVTLVVTSFCEIITAGPNTKTAQKASGKKTAPKAKGMTNQSSTTKKNASNKQAQPIVGSNADAGQASTTEREWEPTVNILNSSVKPLTINADSKIKSSIAGFSRENLTLQPRMTTSIEFSMFPSYKAHLFKEIGKNYDVTIVIKAKEPATFTITNNTGNSISLNSAPNPFQQGAQIPLVLNPGANNVDMAEFKFLYMDSLKELNQKYETIDSSSEDYDLIINNK